MIFLKISGIDSIADTKYRDLSDCNLCYFRLLYIFGSF